MRAQALSLMVALVLLVPTGAAPVDVDDDTVGWWSELPPNFRLAYLHGALEVLSGLGLACPATVTVGEVDTLVRAGVAVGRLPRDTAVTLALLMTVNSLGCRFERMMLDAVSAVMGDK